MHEEMGVIRSQILRNCLASLRLLKKIASDKSIFDFTGEHLKA